MSEGKFIGIGVIPHRSLNGGSQLRTGQVRDLVAAKVGIGSRLHHGRVIQVRHGLFQQGTHMACLAGGTEAGILQLDSAVAVAKIHIHKQVAAEGRNGCVAAAGSLALIGDQLAHVHQIEHPNRLRVGGDLMGRPAHKGLCVVLVVSRNRTRIRRKGIDVRIIGFGTGRHGLIDDNIAHDHAHSQQQCQASLEQFHINTPFLGILIFIPLYRARTALSILL